MSLTNEIEHLFFLSLKLNIDLKMFYIPSKLNDGDTPSRFSSDSDCSLSDSAWNLLEDSFGPYSFDLMAIPSNVRRRKHGGKLNFFSPFPFKESSGVNVFAQSLSFEENYYIFPPFSHQISQRKVLKSNLSCPRCLPPKILVAYYQSLVY